MCKRNSADKNEASMGSVREIPQIKKKKKKKKEKKEKKKKEKKKKASMGYVREPPHRKLNPAWDV